ncbi:unnamed protein product [Closterium sp. NIES-53]
MATFTRLPGSSLYTLATEPPQVAASAQVSAPGQVAPPCSCRLLSHQTLLWHHLLGHPSLPCLRGMHSRLLFSGLPRSLQPRADLPVLHLHSDRGGEFSSNLLRDFCRGEGILQSFTLPDSPQQNGIAEHRIGLVMEVARTSTIHAAAPHFLWPFGVRYAAHQLNLWPRVSLPETSPTLRWTGKVGDASVFRVWGSRAFVRDTSVDKLSARAIPYVFLGFSPDAPGWQFYHPTSRCVFPSQDVTFDDSAPVEVAVGSSPAQGAPSRGAASGGAEPEGAESEGAGSGGAEPRGAEPAGVEPGGAEPEGVEPGGAESEGAESGGAEPRGTSSSGGHAGASPRLSPRPEPRSPQQLREWFAQRTRLWNGVAGAGDSAAGDTGVGGAGVSGGAGGTGGAGGAGAAGPGGARTRGTGAAGTGGAGGAGAGDPTEPGAARARGAGAVGAGAGGTGAGGAGAGGAGAGGDGAVDSRAGGAGGTVRPRPYFVLQRFGFQFSSPQSTPLSTSHSLSAPPSDESVEPSGPYPELVGCLITLGMGLVLGGRGPVVLTGHADASWVDESATKRSSQGYTFSLGSGSLSWRSTRLSSVFSSSCEAEIYVGAMVAQELRWLTYLLTDLGE